MRKSTETGYLTVLTALTEKIGSISEAIQVQEPTPPDLIALIQKEVSSALAPTMRSIDDIKCMLSELVRDRN